MAQALIQRPAARPSIRPVPAPPRPSRAVTAAPAAPDFDAPILRRHRRLQLVLWLGVVYAAAMLASLLYQDARLYRHSQVLTHEWRIEHAERQQAVDSLARANQPQELERLARERLGFVRQDEIAIKLVGR